MRLCLALAFQNDAPWLSLHLRAMAPAVDGIVALDGGSNDNGQKIIRELEGSVYYREFNWNFGAHMQFLLDCVESEDYDAVLRVDPDELISIEDIKTVRKELESGKAHLWMLRRINFVHDRLHWNPDFEPFSQWRAWLTRRGIDYHPVKVHENPRLPRGLATAQSAATIHHYAYLKDPYIRHWRGNMYWALMNDNEAPEYVPEIIPWVSHIPYNGVHILDPEEIGFRAPLEAIPMSYHLDINLAGDRDIEYNFVMSHIPKSFGNNKALDFGSGGINVIAESLLQKGWQVTSLDIENPAKLSGITSIKGDILSSSTPPFDLIISCSAVEHVGLPGRYGVTREDPNGDIKAMHNFFLSLPPEGMLILTLPVGIDHVHSPMHRVYSDRLRELLSGFDVVIAKYWKKTREGWEECSEKEALNTVSISVSETAWQGSVYSLGCFVLRKRSHAAIDDIHDS